jgi:hypothetical protein
MYMVHMRPVVRQYSNRSMRFAAATKNFVTKDAPEDPIDTKQMGRFDQFCKKTQMPTENYCGSFVDFARDDSAACVADGLRPEDGTQDFPRVDK